MLAVTMHKKELKMKKWGVRLIGILFLLLAIGDASSLMGGTSNGFIIYTLGGIRLDITNIITFCLNSYIGFQLIRVNNSGRILAILILWWGILSSACVFIFSLSATKPNQILDTRVGEIDAFLYIILFFAATIAMYSMLLYYLERKDIKALFEPLIIPEIPQTVTDVKV